MNLFEKQYSHSHNKWISDEAPYNEREYVSLYLRADQMHNFYKREEYDLLSYFGDLGGLASVILGVGYFLS